MPTPDFFIYHGAIKKPNPDYYRDRNVLFISVVEITVVPTNLTAINWLAYTANKLNIKSSRCLIIETNISDVDADLRSLENLISTFGFSSSIHKDQENINKNPTGVTDFQWRLAKQDMLMLL